MLQSRLRPATAARRIHEHKTRGGPDVRAAFKRSTKIWVLYQNISTGSGHVKSTAASFE